MARVNRKTFTALEAAETLDLPDNDVVVAGDWHGSTAWIQRALPAVRGRATTLLHLGDFGLHAPTWLQSVDYWAKRAELERIVVTPGNHEDWSRLLAVMDPHPGQAVRLSETVWVLPRGGFRFTVGGRTVLSWGGAASIDRRARTRGRDWWPEELPTESEVEVAVAGGPADVMISHETVSGSGVDAVERMLLDNPQKWDHDALAYSALSRARTTAVWAAARPRLLLHGHMHLRGSSTLADGRRVESLAADQQEGNLVRLGVSDLSVEDIPVSRR